jgi:flagellar basal-body rod modification protein FlgD
MASGSTVGVDASTHKGTGVFDLAGTASNVTVKVSTAGGTTVGTLNLGALEAGEHNFDFDATGYSSADGLKFTIAATNGSATVGSTALVKGTVASVASDTAGALTLKFKDGNTAPYASVKSIL